MYEYFFQAIIFQHENKIYHLLLKKYILSCHYQHLQHYNKRWVFGDSTSFLKSEWLTAVPFHRLIDSSYKLWCCGFFEVLPIVIYLILFLVQCASVTLLRGFVKVLGFSDRFSFQIISRCGHQLWSLSVFRLCFPAYCYYHFAVERILLVQNFKCSDFFLQAYNLFWIWSPVPNIWKFDCAVIAAFSKEILIEIM